jgi:hypothetical protein
MRFFIGEFIQSFWSCLAMKSVIISKTLSCSDWRMNTNTVTDTNNLQAVEQAVGLITKLNQESADVMGQLVSSSIKFGRHIQSLSKAIESFFNLSSTTELMREMSYLMATRLAVEICFHSYTNFSAEEVFFIPMKSTQRTIYLDMYKVLKCILNPSNQAPLILRNASERNDAVLENFTQGLVEEEEFLHFFLAKACQVIECNRKLDYNRKKRGMSERPLVSNSEKKQKTDAVVDLTVSSEDDTDDEGLVAVVAESDDDDSEAPVKPMRLHKLFYNSSYAPKRNPPTTGRNAIAAQVLLPQAHQEEGLAQPQVDVQPQVEAHQEEGLAQPQVDVQPQVEAHQEEGLAQPQVDVQPQVQEVHQVEGQQGLGGDRLVSLRKVMETMDELEQEMIYLKRRISSWSTIFMLVRQRLTNKFGAQS